MNENSIRDSFRQMLQQEYARVLQARTIGSRIGSQPFHQVIQQFHALVRGRISQSGCSEGLPALPECVKQQWGGLKRFGSGRTHLSSPAVFSAVYGRILDFFFALP
jgi:hypothetical protein